MPQVASCMFMCLPALSCTVVHRERGKEGGKRGEGGGKEEKKIRPPGPPREGAKKSGFTVRDSPGQSGTSTFVAKDSRDLFLGSWTTTL